MSDSTLLADLPSAPAYRVPSPTLPRVRSWRVDGHVRFKALVSELRLLLADLRAELIELEAALPPGTVSALGAAEQAELLAALRAGPVAEFQTLYNAVAPAALGVSASDHGALKQFARRELEHDFMQSAFMRRARDKPRGYPGDYVMMNFIYEDHLSGDSLFTRVLNLACVTVPTAISVVERKNLIKRELRALIAAHGESERPLRVLSIAAGPAQEIYELIAEGGARSAALEIVLFDQDADALAFAQGRIQPWLLTAEHQRVQVTTLQAPIRKLLRGDEQLRELGGFDLIFSCGLFDYLQDDVAAALLRRLYACLLPGRTLYVGNQTPISPNRWSIEMLCDWYLIYRTREALRELARDAVPEAASVALLDEPTGVNPLVALTAPR